MRKLTVADKLEQMKPLGRHEHRWENNIKMYHKDTG
jgi:hypothetical protein